ncbi:hypothetical protein PMAYCL1PPCAC_17498, partial [Pristionchus mayeri]
SPLRFLPLVYYRVSQQDHHQWKMDGSPFHSSTFSSKGAYAEIATLLRQYEAIEQNQTTADDYGLSDTTSCLQRMHRARVMLRLLMAKLSNGDRIAAGYSFTELVSECTFAGETCTSADFTSFLHPDYGVCYSFTGTQMITRSGNQEGLRMLLTVNQDSPLAGTFDFLPTTDSATVWAMIYDKGDFLDFTKDGIRVGASTQSFVALSKTTHSRMAKPYGNCSDDSSPAVEYYGNFTYTLHNCQHACLQRLASERCGCVDPLFPKIANETYCTTGPNMKCLISLTNDVATANSKEGRTMCGCLPPCKDFLFQKTITNSIFPSENYKVATGTQAQRDVLLGDQGGGRTGGGSDDSDDYEVWQEFQTTCPSIVISSIQFLLDLLSATYRCATLPTPFLHHPLVNDKNIQELAKNAATEHYNNLKNGGMVTTPGNGPAGATTSGSAPSGTTSEIVHSGITTGG